MRSSMMTGDELTEAGFRRMVQAHSAGLNAVIGIDSREGAGLQRRSWACSVRCRAGKRSSRDVELIEAHRSTHSTSSRVAQGGKNRARPALNMINKERERPRSRSMLPWYARDLDRATPRVSSGVERTANWRDAHELVRRSFGDDPRERDARRAVGACHGKTVRCDRRRGRVRVRSPLQRSSGTPELATTALAIRCRARAASPCVAEGTQVGWGQPASMTDRFVEPVARTRRGPQYSMTSTSFRLHSALRAAASQLERQTLLPSDLTPPLIIPRRVALPLWTSVDGNCRDPR